MLIQNNNCFGKGAAFLSKYNFHYLEEVCEMTDIKQKVENRSQGTRKCLE